MTVAIDCRRMVVGTPSFFDELIKLSLVELVLRSSLSKNRHLGVVFLFSEPRPTVALALGFGLPFATNKGPDVLSLPVLSMHGLAGTSSSLVPNTARAQRN